MGFESKRGWRLAGAVCAALLLGITLFAPALINRQPILYSDSVGYFHAGYAAVEQIATRLHPVTQVSGTESRSGQAPTPRLARQEKDGISTARSVYYGLSYVMAYLAGGVWAPVACQVLLTLACLLLAARRSLAMNAWVRWAALFAISLVSGLGFFADTMMPDVFAGLMLLAVGMLLAYGKQLRDWERAFWLAIVLLACLFHKSHLLILILVLFMASFFLWRKHAKELAQLLAAAILGFAGHYAVELTVGHLTGKPPIATPFLLARLIGDGTAQEYLAQACPTRHFATCKYLPRMPMSENEFLWSRDPEKSIMGTADRDTRAAIVAESGEIVRATILEHPVQQLLATAKGILRQFTTVGVTELGLIPSDDANPIAILRPVMENYRASAIATGKSVPLAVISATMLAVYIASFMGSLLLFRRHASAAPAHRLAAILLVGVGANAIVCGAISGVFDRYQGRVAWLALMALAVLLANALHRSQRGTE